MNKCTSRVGRYAQGWRGRVDGGSRKSLSHKAKKPGLRSIGQG
jgi:hypothetical protein